MSKTILITGGGTGGHLSVAKSFIEELYNLGYEVIFVGSTKGQDKQWFENYPLISHTYFLDTKGVVNQNFLGKIVALFMILRAVISSIKIIKKHKISKVISVGGFSAAAASFASIITKTDFYIHEQNSVMGRLNRLTSKYAKEVFSSYSPTSKVKDYPIAQNFFEHQRVRDEVKTVIFLGGSQGASALNDFALKVAPRLQKMGISIIHQTGKKDFDVVVKKYQQMEIQADVFDFSKQLIEKMTKADFAVSRAGASTLWELVALGIPTFFIPYPHAAANHQYHNAQYLMKNNLCFLQTENQLDENYFFECLGDNIEFKSEKLLNSIHRDAVKNIVDIIVR